MRRFYLILFFALCFLAAATAQNQYTFSLDLTACKDDILRVELIVPKINTKEIVYHIPKIVPGTYEIYNFGRFISDFHALDVSGNELFVDRLDINSWKITDADKLAKIVYNVEDSWDTSDRASFVFEPAGSNFEESKNFVLNTHCLFGYIDGMIRIPYEVNIKYPSGFYGSCSLTDVISQNNTDTYRIANYMDLQDAPMMYCIPDTTILNIGAAQILISVYSPNKTTTSKFIAKNIKDVLIAQEAYLGGALPIKKYAYLIYLTDEGGLSGLSGALEHSHSSMYFFPEMEQEYLAQTIKDVSAHEFFHIVTPLNIHSEEIGDFDYAAPKMSQHLWLYEGATEYSAGLVQVKYGKMTIQEYLGILDDKILQAKKFNDSLPFTVLSKGCLDTYKKEYRNVYQKGALINLCLDLKLRHLSSGNYGLQELMQDLSAYFGKDKSFQDDELFQFITKLTYPEIGEFFRRYVQGTEPLPIAESLAYAGVEFDKIAAEKKIGIGGVAIGYNDITKHIQVLNTSSMDSFGVALGYKEGDEIIKFNGKKMKLENAQELIGDYFRSSKEGDALKMIVERKQLTTGKVKKMKLKSIVFAVAGPPKYELTVSPNPTPEQLDIRKSWIGKH